MQINGVPNEIDWQPVADFLESLGLNLTAITRDGVRVGWDAIQAEVYALDTDGHRYLDPFDDSRAATHTVSIPVRHRPVEDAQLQRQGGPDSAAPNGPAST